MNRRQLLAYFGAGAVVAVTGVAISTHTHTGSVLSQKKAFGKEFEWLSYSIAYDDAIVLTLVLQDENRLLLNLDVCVEELPPKLMNKWRRGNGNEPQKVMLNITFEQGQYRLFIDGEYFPGCKSVTAVPPSPQNSLIDFTGIEDYDYPVNF